MNLTDPIADMFTRIRNGLLANLEYVSIPASRLKVAILEILRNQGYISSFQEIEGKNGRRSLKVKLKYKSNGKPMISELKRISKPGKRTYVAKRQIPKVLNGFGVIMLNTSIGLIDGKAARLANVGGEVVGIVT